VSLEPRSAAAYFDPARLKLARQLRGYTRAELARRSGLSAAAVSQYETHTHAPRAATVAQLAISLGVPIAFLATTGKTTLLPTVEDSFFRSLRRTTQRDRERASALAGLAAELVRAIDNAVVLPAFEPHPDLALDANNSAEAAETAAAIIRTRWQVPDGPIDHVVRLLERHGVVVIRSALAESQDVDAYSWTGGLRPLVILGTDRGGYERSRLNAAHELAHVLLHAADPEPANPSLERQAQRFASALLVPADALRDEWPGRRIDWNHLQRLRARRGISMAALLYRAKDLAIVTPTAYTNAMKYLSRRGWRRREPGPERPPEQPALLAKALELLAAHGTTLETIADEAHLIAVGELCEQLGILADTRPKVEI
jgi:Zn-dependent peptidase ImmA (M78 family)/DNA-binding XRE family transcriptional regulator